MIPLLQSSGGRSSFSLPFTDLGSGIVSTADIRGGSAATFTRASNAIAKLSTGNWAVVTSGNPRSMYSGMSTAVGSYMGYYSEGAQTERGTAAATRDLTNAAWTPTSVTVLKDQTGITGVTNTCSSLTATGAGGTVLQSVVLASGARVFQPFVKRLVGTGTVSITLDGGATTTDITSLINSTNLVQVSATQTLANPNFGFVLATSGDSIAVDFANLLDGTFASTPINASARNADSLTYSTSPWYNAAVGTAVGTVRVPYLVGAVQNIFQVDDGTANNRITVSISAAAKVNFQVVDSSVAQANIGNVSVTANTSFKFAAAWQANDFAISVNGAAPDTDSAGTIPAGITTLNVGKNQATAFNLFGGVMNFRYFPQRLPNSQLQSLST